MGKSSKINVKTRADFSKETDQELIQYRAALEVEMRKRHLGFSVGQIGESLVIEHFKRTPGLPKLLRSPVGTKNVDALSRNGERYSIKTVWNAKKTGTIYPDPNDKKKQLFEFILIAQLNDKLTLKSIHQFSWNEFIEVRSWDSRMSSWYISCSLKVLSRAKQILKKDAAD